MAPMVWTVGHSTRPEADFLAVLASCQIELVADVRRFPGSRRQPHYAESALRAALAAEAIEYCWLPALGGRRRPVGPAQKSGWRNEAFRGYAEHLESEEFAAGLFDLLMLASGLRTAIMCAEVLWWRCHRRLIADVLVSFGWRVVHLLDTEHRQAHVLSAPARLKLAAVTAASALPPG